jgi:hypothetical protein
MFKASIVALVMIVTMAPHLATQSKPAPAVFGLWESETCVVQDRDGNRTSSKSTFVFLGREWALEFLQFADDRCTRPTMKAFLAGQYQITEPSSVVPMAHDATFGFSQEGRHPLRPVAHCRSQPRVQRAYLETGRATGRDDDGLFVGDTGLGMSAGIRSRPGRRQPPVSGRAAAAGTEPVQGGAPCADASLLCARQTLTRGAQHVVS